MSTPLSLPVSAPVNAYLVGKRLEIRGIEWPNAVAFSPLVVPAGKSGGGYAVLFRYGAVVLFGLTKEEENGFLADVSRFVPDPYEVPETEGTIITRPSGPDGDAYVGEIRIGAPTPETLQIIADVLGKSVALAYYESKIAKAFQKIEPLAENLSRAGSPGVRPRELLKHLGETLLAETTMSGRIEIRDKPELLWENPQHEKLHLQLSAEYELADRHSIVEHKTKLISKTAETILGILQHRSSIRVEWYITILILVEISITLYQMAF